MSSALVVSFHDQMLPWAGSLEDDQRFNRVLRTVLALIAILCVLALIMPAAVPDRSKNQDVRD